MSEKAPRKVSDEKYNPRTREQLAQQLQSVAERLGRRAAKSAGVIEATNTESNNITTRTFEDGSTYVNHQTPTTETIVSQLKPYLAQGHEDVRTRFDKTVTDPEEGVVKGHVGASSEITDRGSISIGGNKDLYKDGRFDERERLTPDQVTNVAAKTTRKIRQEIVSREKAHKESQRAPDPDMEDILAA